MATTVPTSDDKGLALKVRPVAVERIKLEHGIKSDEELGIMLHISRKTLSRIKNGGQPNGRFIAGMAYLFGVTSLDPSDPEGLYVIDRDATPVVAV